MKAKRNFFIDPIKSAAGMGIQYGLKSPGGMTGEKLWRNPYFQSRYSVMLKKTPVENQKMINRYKKILPDVCCTRYAVVSITERKPHIQVAATI